LLSNEFGSPDWTKLYPLKESGEVKEKGQLLTPRLACKLFHDGLYIIQKGEENAKFVQDRIPEVAHKCYKKKQWRKQFFESMRRVCCRLAIGLGFRPNCMAEDAFIHAILGMSFELGWRRINDHIEHLPESPQDRDYGRVLKFGANDDVGNMLKGVDATTTTSTASKTKKTTVNASVDIKGWFKCYDTSQAHMFDHIVLLEADETDNWSVTTSSDGSSIGSRQRADSNMSIESSSDSELSGPDSPMRGQSWEPRLQTVLSCVELDTEADCGPQPAEHGAMAEHELVGALTQGLVV